MHNDGQLFAPLSHRFSGSIVQMNIESHQSPIIIRIVELIYVPYANRVRGLRIRRGVSPR